MAHIRITESKGRYIVSIDEYSDITFSEKTFEKAKERAVILVKDRILSTLPKKEEEEKPVKRVSFGFAA